MRAELPWNVAGIPPEAREAARAAARREGLSVGEWLTRRILRSFSGTDDDSTVLPYEQRAPSAAPLDSWGLPPSAASRRDSEEMLARVGRSENESNEAWRRIEEQLKGLGRRVDFSERSHSESNRALSRTAQEMNISAREQAQAFEQLGKNIMGLHERLERLERSTPSDGLRDAVKALHQGLSRLADQITSTANNSASQLMQVTTNLEKLAGHVGQIWEDADGADQLLNRRIDVSVQELDQRIQDSEDALGARLSQAEKTAQFNANTLDHALEKIEAGVGQRATDQVEYQRRAAQYEESLQRLQDEFSQLESRLPGSELEERLEDIGQAVGSLTTRLATQLEQDDSAQKFDASLQSLSHRLEDLEKQHADLIAEMQAKVVQPPEPAMEEAVAEASAPEAFQAEPPPAYEPPAYEPPSYESQSDGFQHEDDAVDAFTPPQDFSFDTPQDTDEEAYTSEFAGVFEEPENFLAQARRSAREASEKAEDERRDRLSAFRWSQNEGESEEKARSRYLIPVIVALVVMLAAAAALVLSQRAKAPEPATKPVSSAAKGPAFSAPSNSIDTLPVVPPQTGSQPGGQTGSQSSGQPNGQSGAGNAKDFSSSEPLPPVPAPQHETSNPPVKPAASSAPVKSAPAISAPAKPVPASNAAIKPAPASVPAKKAASLDRVIALVNAGNPTALAIMGLRALDGTNGAPVNLPDAVKFLSQAAEKGQAVAQYRLGTVYERGQGVPVDTVKAAHWYEMAANQGNRKAMHNLAVSYAGGASGRKNMAEAARWFAKAAALGLSDSQFNLAVLYERGDGVPQSLVDAYKWYAIAAASGDSESKARIGVLQTQLSDTDKVTASKSAVSFHATPLNRSVNVPPEPADLGT
jgi:localization factor PodJL